jgi:membrane protease YdiL (CAAX protease family)
MSGSAPSSHGRLRRARRRLADGPAIVPAMSAAAAYAVIMVYSRVALGHEMSVDRILATLAVAVLAGLVLTLVLSRRRHRPAPPVLRWIDVSEAVDDGRLPDDADPDSWRGVLLRRREVHDQLGGPWAVLAAAAILVGTIALGVLGGPPLAWTLPAVAAAAVAGMALVRRDRVARIDALLQPLLDADRAPRADADADADA